MLYFLAKAGIASTVPTMIKVAAIIEQVLFQFMFEVF
jgi:hypothetical protein